MTVLLPAECRDRGGRRGRSGGEQRRRTWREPWPDKQVDLYFPGERPLARHHPRIWRRIRRRLDEFGVTIHPDHRALLPDGFAGDQITDEPVRWSTGRPPASRPMPVLWAIGQVRPNTDWLPENCSTRTASFAVTPGATGSRSPRRLRRRRRRGHRSAAESARKRADGLLAHNVRAEFGGAALRATARREAAGVRCSVRSPTGSRCSPPTGGPFDSPRGRSTAC